jgi:hypothetical protein
MLSERNNLVVASREGALIRFDLGTWVVLARCSGPEYRPYHHATRHYAKADTRFAELNPSSLCGHRLRHTRIDAKVQNRSLW